MRILIIFLVDVYIVITYVYVEENVKIINIHLRVKFTILSVKVISHLIMNIIINDKF